MYYVFDKGIELMLPDMKITELDLLRREKKNRHLSTGSNESSGLATIPRQHLDCFSLELYLFFGDRSHLQVN